jgi:3-oxoacyl-[acyl-carrier-protein] synthase II
MENCYINGIGSISAQKSFEKDFMKDPIQYTDENILKAVKPNYKDFISPSTVRRMSSGVKNGIVASKIAMSDANVDSAGAIITGTGMGCMQDSEKFLDNLINHDEEYLTPTSFIQSTHNTVGGQVALGLKCKAYNFTYVNTGVSFESALLDGLMQVENQDGQNILVGGIDELADHTSKLYKLIEHTKSDDEAPYDILNKRSKGSISGEGATFFVLDKEKNENSYCELVDVKFINNLETSKLKSFATNFLKSNDLSLSDIDAVILGNNGDIDYDIYYDEIEPLFSNADILFYKHLFGEFMTSSSVSVSLASNILKSQKIPNALFKNKKSQSINEIKNLLIYNQYRGKDHSLILLKNV